MTSHWLPSQQTNYDHVYENTLYMASLEFFDYVTILLKII